MRTLSFTRLRTVKNDVNSFEQTYSDFMANLICLMSTSPSQNGVRYDDKNNCYIIKIDEIEYVALYREKAINKNCDNKQLVEELDELVQISNNKNEIARKRIEDEKKALEEYDRIIKNGKRGILNNSKEKKIYIDYLKKEFKENGLKVFSNSFESIKNLLLIESKYAMVYFGCEFIVLFVIGIILFVIAHFAAIELIKLVAGYFVMASFFDPAASFILDIITCITGSQFFLKSILTSVLTLAISPFIIGKNIVKKIVQKIKLNKKIGPIEKSIYRNDKKKEKVKVTTQDIVDLMDFNKEKEDTGISKRSKNITTKDLDDLKNDILSINNKNARDKFTNELREIVKYYTEAFEHMDIDKQVVIIQSFFDQTSNLRSRVEEELINEREQASFMHENDILMDKVAPQKTIGAR